MRCIMYSSYYPTSSNELELTVIFITVFYIIAIISSIVSLILCGVMAARKERSVGGWIVGGLFLQIQNRCGFIPPKQEEINAR